MQWVTEYDATNVAGTQPRKNMITMGKVDTWYQTAHLSLDSNVYINAVYAVYDDSFALLMHDLIMADFLMSERDEPYAVTFLFLSLHTSICISPNVSGIIGYFETLLLLRLAGICQKKWSNNMWDDALLPRHIIRFEVLYFSVHENDIDTFYRSNHDLLLFFTRSSHLGAQYIWIYT